MMKSGDTLPWAYYSCRAHIGTYRQWCFAAFLQLKIFSLFRGRQVMADKEQAEENGRGGDVVDGNSQGGKKGKKGEFVLWNRLIPPVQIYLTKPTQEKVERVLKKTERRLSSSWALTSRKSWGRPWRCSACRTRSNKSGRWSIKSSQIPLQSAPKSEEDASKKNFQFWSTQPVRVLAENQNLSQNLQVPALEEVITSNECISQDVPTEEVDTYFPLKIKYIILHSRSGKSHTVSLTVSNGTRCSLMILWCSKRWEGQIKV